MNGKIHTAHGQFSSQFTGVNITGLKAITSFAITIFALPLIRPHMEPDASSTSTMRTGPASAVLC